MLIVLLYVDSYSYPDKHPPCLPNYLLYHGCGRNDHSQNDRDNSNHLTLLDPHNQGQVIKLTTRPNLWTTLWVSLLSHYLAITTA